MKMDEKRMDTLRKKLGLAHMEVVDYEGKGRIAVLWSKCQYVTAKQIEVLY
jgi:hypothetical protein